MIEHPLDPPRTTREQVPLAPLTTLEIGGPARYFCEAESEGTLVDSLRWAHAENIPTEILGAGSNVIVSDGGFEGLVIRMITRGFRVDRDGPLAQVTVAAGEPWDEVVAQTVEQEFAGLECLSGIPGHSGATPIQNVGAYGQEVSKVISSVDVIDRVTGEQCRLTPKQCDFGYRTSRFRRDPSEFVVVAVTFDLIPGGRPTLRYEQLIETLDARGRVPPLTEVREAVLSLRRSKSMVLDPSDPNRRSIGSFFVNPVVRVSDADLIEEGEPDVGMPRFPGPDGRVKIPAAWLIERSGFTKGFQRGTVGISTKHSLALVNHGGGRAAELIGLARDIRDAVRDRFGIDLRPEPTFLGFPETDPTARGIAD